MAKKTPLYQKHKQSGARFIDFGEYSMPVWYKGIKEEHKAVRENSGLFDINHMGAITVKGSDREAFINYVITNNLNKIDIKKILYSFICDDTGLILDDLLVYKDEDSLLLIVNSGQSEMLINHLKSHQKNYRIELENISEKTGFLSLQGPKSFKLCNKVFGIDPNEIPYYSFIHTHYKNHSLMISRTGYTGEEGIELLFDTSLNESIWDQLLSLGKEDGIEPCGLGVRDLLRLEMGFPLHGHDLKGHTPFELQKNRCVDYNKDDFIGKSKLLSQKEKGQSTSSKGFVLEEKGIPREGYKVFKDNKEIGIVTSGGFSLLLNKGIGLCLINCDQAKIDNQIQIQIRQQKIPAKISKIPFVPSHVK